MPRSSEDSDGGDPTSLYVNGLNFATTSTELRELFSRYGKVKDVYIPLNFYTGRPRGFAYVEFDDVEDAKDAIHGLNKASAFGRQLFVEMAKTKRRKPGSGPPPPPPFPFDGGYGPPGPYGGYYGPPPDAHFGEHHHHGPPEYYEGHRSGRRNSRDPRSLSRSPPRTSVPVRRPRKAHKSSSSRKTRRRSPTDDDDDHSSRSPSPPRRKAKRSRRRKEAEAEDDDAQIIRAQEA